MIDEPGSAPSPPPPQGTPGCRVVRLRILHRDGRDDNALRDWLGTEGGIGEQNAGMEEEEKETREPRSERSYGL
ncbi:unnamed protein product [Pleuronectes platessa]|uniref:Uncharacterized protein n=1 Tax=Pleuronectes platessa TaxID=8262 RepID=A0A9N7Z1P1_PLEPL|nr:unnamed protein product [Pleuronectes platessa]